MPLSVLSDVPRGVFCLLPSSTGGAGKDPAVYSDPNVDGISARQGWSDLEPVEGAFDFSFLDTVVSKAAAGGKQVLLRIGTSGGSANTGGNTPNWVFDAVKAEALPESQKFFTFNDKGTARTIPVFWDPIYLAKKKAMIRALGAHFSSNAAVKIVAASFANSQSEDWAVPHDATDVANWFATGYTTEKMLNAGKQIIDTTMAAFPSQYVTLAVGGNGHVGGSANLDPDENYLARNCVLAARALWPGRLIVQKNTLATFTPKAPGIGTLYELLWNGAPDIAGQMLYWCYDDPSYRVGGGVAIDPSKALTNSVDIGVAYGMKYIEIYRADILNLPAAVKYAHDTLTAGTLGLAAVADLNGDAQCDYVLYNRKSRATAIWYLNNNAFLRGAYAPVLPNAWQLVTVADLNGDAKPDYVLYNPNTRQTALWYLNNNVFLGGASGPTLPDAWELVTVADLNGDTKPDYVLYNPHTRQTALWYLNNNVLLGGAYGPTLPNAWQLVSVADLNGDAKPDYVLYNPNTRQTALWYLNNNVLLRGAYGPTLPDAWQLVSVADLNRDAKRDYVLYNTNTRQTALWYMYNNVFVSSAYGPTLPIQ